MSPSDNSDITLVITCFNYGRFLSEAVESALGQRGGPPQVVVVDDGSTDEATIETVDDLPAEVEVVRQANAGVCAARNVGLERVGTPYAVVLDADDRFTPGALQAMRAPLDADASLGFAYGLMRFFGDWEGLLRLPAYDPYVLLYRHTIGLSALMRRDLVEQVGGFDPAFTEYEDWELWLHALARGWHGRQVEAVTLEYRRHRGSKQLADRDRYRDVRRQLRVKHRDLYRDASTLARESSLSPTARLLHRAYWGPRPLPARMERGLHRLLWGRRATRLRRRILAR